MEKSFFILSIFMMHQTMMARTTNTQKQALARTMHITKTLSLGLTSLISFCSSVKSSSDLSSAPMIFEGNMVCILSPILSPVHIWFLSIAFLMSFESTILLIRTFLMLVEGQLRLVGILVPSRSRKSEPNK